MGGIGNGFDQNSFMYKILTHKKKEPKQDEDTINTVEDVESAQQK